MSARNLKSMEGETINPERPHNQKRQRSPASHRPRASKIKAKQHPAPAQLAVKSAVPTDESTETSSDDENEVNLVENATSLSEGKPRPEITDPAWIGKTSPLVTVRSPHHGTDKTIVYLARFDRVVGLCPFTRKTSHPKCFMAYVTVMSPLIAPTLSREEKCAYILVRCARLLAKRNSCLVLVPSF